jgi:hypothetical protein
MRSCGVISELEVFEREESAVADVLWFAYVTNSAGGKAMKFEARITDILTRYEPGYVVHETTVAARRLLAAAVDRALCPAG